MPKDEFDPDDPMELHGVALLTEEDTMGAMTECFIEEFLRLGYNHKQVLALFRNPHYTGMNLVWQNKGEQYIRDRISESFARRGRGFTWPADRAGAPEKAPSDEAEIRNPKSESPAGVLPSAAAGEPGSAATDPMGAPAPQFRL